MGGIGAIVKTMIAVSNRVQRCSKSVIFILCSIGLPQAIVLPFITAGMLLERGMTLLVGFRIASQCTSCKAVFTVLPHFILRYRKMRPDAARDALLATHGGLSLELCATICHISPMALYRLICALGQYSLVNVLVKCHLPLPAYILADEKHSKCLTERVY